MNITNSDLSLLVKKAMKDKNINLEECCNMFNNRYLQQINRNELKPLNKDFVSRVCRGEFKVLSHRISKLCEFLEIQEINDNDEPLKVLMHQIDEFQSEAKVNLNLKRKYFAIINFLAGLNLNPIQKEK